MTGNRTATSCGIALRAALEALRLLVRCGARLAAAVAVVAACAVSGALAQAFPQQAPPLELPEDYELIVPVVEILTAWGVPDRETVIDSVHVIDGVDVVAGAALHEGDLRITPAPDSSGPFTLRTYVALADTTVIEDIRGVVTPRSDLPAGMLQSSETHEGRPGVVRVYTADRVLVAEVQADASGRFPRAQLPLDREEYVIQAVITRAGERFGFVRTLQVELAGLGEDLDLPVIRTVPFDGLDEVGMDSATFREHVLRVTRGRIERWDMDAMNGVFIAGQTRRGRFSSGEIERIRQLFEEPNGVRSFVRGRAFGVHDSRTLSGAPYAVAGGKIEPHRGWIVIAPDTVSEVSSSSSAADVDGDGVYDRGAILINPPRASRLGDVGRLVTYEAGRVLGMAAHSDPLFFTYTMMVPGMGPQVPEKPTVVDAKTGAILYEQSFPVHHDLELLLGLEFDVPRANRSED